MSNFFDRQIDNDAAVSNDYLGNHWRESCRTFYRELSCSYALQLLATTRKTEQLRNLICRPKSGWSQPNVGSKDDNKRQVPNTYKSYECSK